MSEPSRSKLDIQHLENIPSSTFTWQVIVYKYLNRNKPRSPLTLLLLKVLRRLFGSPKVGALFEHFRRFENGWANFKRGPSFVMQSACIFVSGLLNVLIRGASAHIGFDLLAHFLTLFIYRELVLSSLYLINITLTMKCNMRKHPR